MKVLNTRIKVVILGELSHKLTGIKVVNFQE